MAVVQAGRAGARYGTRVNLGSHLLPAPAVKTWRQPPRLAAWVVLDPYVELEPEGPPTGDGESWAMVECASRKAYGCRKHTQEVLDGLTLHQRLIETNRVDSSIPHLSTALYLQASERALRGIKAEFRAEFAAHVQDGLYQADYERLFAKGHVESTEDNLIVLTVILRLGSFRLVYYLVYDGSDMSLVMIPCPPYPHEASYGTKPPLPVRRDDGAYELLVLTQRRAPLPSPKEFESILCLRTPEAECVDPWRMLALNFPVVMGPFSSEVMFAFKGKAFFVDLSQGILYLDLPGADDISAGDFKFIPLPESPHDSRFPSDYDISVEEFTPLPEDPRSIISPFPAIPNDRRWDNPNPEDNGPRNINRTMRRVGDVVKFVCIDRSSMEVTVWTLEMPEEKWLPGSKKKWNEDKRFVWTDIDHLFRFCPQSLPRTLPRFPILMPDGTLSLVLPYKRITESDPRVDCVCNLDLRGSKSLVYLVWWSSLLNYRLTYPCFVRSDFFKMLKSPRSLLRGSIFF